MSEVAGPELEDIIGPRVWLIRLRYLLAGVFGWPHHPDGTPYHPSGA